MIIVVGSWTPDSPFYMYFEVEDGMNEEDLKKIIFEGIKYTYENIRDYKKSVERVIGSKVFKEYLASKGFRMIKPEVEFIFYGMNSIDFRSVESDDLDDELWDFLERKIRGGD